MDTPGKIIAIGLNYVDHAAEAGMVVPDEPICFAKWSTCLVGPGDAIRIPPISAEVDYEAELAVIIGRTVSNASVDDALDCVSGYACFNDVTARDLQRRDGQWSRSKSFDTFGPIGPVVPASEIADPQALAIRCRLNGDVVQDSNTSKMVFSVAAIIAYVSQSTTLTQGDIIATGTPAGIGMAQVPPRFLRPGDEVTIEIDGLGALTNPVTGPS